jgi:hypothetical protein
MSIKLNCISCGHAQDLSDAYENYQGQIRCWGCSTTLDVSIIEGKLQSMQRHGETPEGPAPLLSPQPVMLSPEPEMEVVVVTEEKKVRKAR